MTARTSIPKAQARLVKGRTDNSQERFIHVHTIARLHPHANYSADTTTGRQAASWLEGPPVWLTTAADCT